MRRRLTQGLDFGAGIATLTARRGVTTMRLLPAASSLPQAPASSAASPWQQDDANRLRSRRRLIVNYFLL